MKHILNKISDGMLEMRGKYQLLGYKPMVLAIVSTILLLVSLSLITGCAGGPLTKREIGTGVGAAGGAAAGAIIGNQTGNAGKGAGIGGLLGGIFGWIIGDQLQGQEQQGLENERKIRELELEIERLKREQERLRENR